jgi:SpoVK/Ycf46/Vps4 family AAA+-type ATPase
LYVVGGGDLGTTAANLDKALQQIFDVATAWKAIVLIDEVSIHGKHCSIFNNSFTDDFLFLGWCFPWAEIDAWFRKERHGSRFVSFKKQPNRKSWFFLIQIFSFFSLRHVEYYRGILFLTTNRVKAFDEAFLSRIHVALHFHDLSQESKLQIWKAFISKIGASASITSEQICMLAKRNVNGRQIKNAARTAQSLAVGKGELVTFEHLNQTLDVMEEFQAEFQELKKD